MSSTFVRLFVTDGTRFYSRCAIWSSIRVECISVLPVPTFGRSSTSIGVHFMRTSSHFQSVSVETMGSGQSVQRSYGVSHGHSVRLGCELLGQCKYGSFAEVLSAIIARLVGGTSRTNTSFIHSFNRSLLVSFLSVFICENEKQNPKRNSIDDTCRIESMRKTYANKTSIERCVKDRKSVV